jgi:hypothetical protein
LSDDESGVLQAHNSISPLEFLEAVYTNEELPLMVRMRAAIAAAQYRHPKLAVTANLTGQDIGARLDLAVQRSREAKLIEGRLIEGREVGAAPEVEAAPAKLRRA